MNKTARAIVLNSNGIILIHRKKLKNGKMYEYYATPGGHLENDETFEEACYREVKEELGLDVEIESLFMELKNDEIDTLEKYYLVNIVSGTLGTGNGEEFTNRDFEKYGSYEIEIIDKNRIGEINLLPIELKEKLIKYFKGGI